MTDITIEKLDKATIDKRGITKWPIWTKGEKKGTVLFKYGRVHFPTLKVWSSTKISQKEHIWQKTRIVA